MSTNYVAAVFLPWWDEAETGPAPDCAICGCSMVRGREALLLIWGPGPVVGHRDADKGWECLSCGNYIPDAQEGK